MREDDSIFNMEQPDSINLVDLDFIATRHKLIDVAAFLDRVERVGADDDFRVQALKQALPLLQSTEGDRARKILEAFSDHSTDPIEKAPGKGASGTVPPGSPA